MINPFATIDSPLRGIPWQIITNVWSSFPIFNGLKSLTMQLPTYFGLMFTHKGVP